MSLKSKLEAVIYAAEEPVTLTQLAALFAAEALEWKAAQETALVEQGAAANTVVDPTQPLLGEGLEYLDLRTEDGTLVDQPGFAVLPAVEAEPPSTSQETAEDSGTNQDAPAAELATTDVEGEAKRLARQRDREVKAVLRQ